MATGLSSDNQGNSTRPYLLRALHEWCTDNGFTPYLAVQLGAGVQVPMDYVKNNEIVLNVSFEATSGLKLGNEFIEFKARFGGITREIQVPVSHVVAIYARENGQGMAFPMPTDGATTVGNADPHGLAGAAGTSSAAGPRGLRLATPEPARQPAGEVPPQDPPEPTQPPPGGRPSLKRIK